MSDVTYRSTKKFGHSAGLSCCFRQFKADSHCRFLHGYALAVKIEFEAIHLDDRNWVVDFGALTTIKAKLEAMFDHKTVVADNDPHIEWFLYGHRLGVIDLVTVHQVGCEAFAEMISVWARRFLIQENLNERVRVAQVEVSEHEGNSAIAICNGEHNDHVDQAARK